MAAAAILAFVTICVFVGVGIAGSRMQAAHRQSKLSAIAQSLAGSAVSNEAIGRYRGLPVVYRFATRGAGSSSESWTEVDVDLPRAYPLELHVRRHLRSDALLIEHGAMIDVQVGDVEFDPAFLVEAAPADVARLLLDREARCYLASHAEIDLETLAHGERKLLRLGIRGWHEELPDALGMIELATRIAARVREAFATAEASSSWSDRGSPYRPQLDDRPAQDAAAVREREVAEVGRVREIRARASREASVAMLVLLGIFLFLGLLAAAAGR